MFSFFLCPRALRCARFSNFRGAVYVALVTEKVRNHDPVAFVCKLNDVFRVNGFSKSKFPRRKENAKLLFDRFRVLLRLNVVVEECFFSVIRRFGERLVVSQNRVSPREFESLRQHLYICSTLGSGCTQCIQKILLFSVENSSIDNNRN